MIGAATQHVLTSETDAYCFTNSGFRSAGPDLVGPAKRERADHSLQKSLLSTN